MRRDSQAHPRLGRRDMSEQIKIGMRISDNDPRMIKRVLRVVAIGAGIKGAFVIAEDYRGKTTTIRQDRIYSDGKPRKSGWSVVT